MTPKRCLTSYLAQAACLLALLLSGRGICFGQVTERAITPTPEAKAKHERLIGQIIEPELELHIDPTRSKLIRTKLPVSRIAITDPDVLEVNQYSPTEFEMIGRKSGETTLTMWFGAAGQPQSVLRYLVYVAPDRAEQQRAEMEYSHLQQRVNEMFPNSQIQLIPIADKLIIRGQARDAQEVTQIMAVVRGQAGNQAGGQNGGYAAINPVDGGTTATIPGAEDLPNTTVISLLDVPGEQQVMLKVRIAELTRSALRELGVDFSVVDNSFSISNVIGGAGNITAILDSGDVNLFIKAFSSNGHSKILAEPTLVTLSGQTATFIAGGEFAVPTAVGIDGISAASTTFKGFGTQLSFTPTVIDKDRIRLLVAPSFSSINSDNTVDGIPGLDVRAVTTTVDLREGQWLAIAGLIQDKQEGSRGRIPFLGDISVIGAAFGNQRIKRDETELVVLVSPQLVHPLERDQVPLMLPGMEVTEPTGAAFFLHQQIEGNPNHHHRSTVWPVHRRAIHLAKKAAVREARRAAKCNPSYQISEQYYIQGPQGFSD